MNNTPKHWINQDDSTPAPIQSDWDRAAHKQYAGSTVPMWLAEIAYTAYVKHGGAGQSLKRLNERGGFGREEFLVFLRDALNLANLPKF